MAERFEVGAHGGEQVQFPQFLLVDDLAKVFGHVLRDGAEALHQKRENEFMDAFCNHLLQNRRFDHGFSSSKTALPWLCSSHLLPMSKRCRAMRKPPCPSSIRPPRG